MARLVSSSSSGSREGCEHEDCDEDARPEEADEIAMTLKEGLRFGGFAVRTNRHRAKWCGAGVGAACGAGDEGRQRGGGHEVGLQPLRKARVMRV